MDIVVDSLTYTYTGQPGPALRDVSLEVRCGELCCLVGANGAGKSTLCCAVAGFVPHFYRGEMYGAVVVGGQDTVQRTIGELARRVGIVFQNPFDQLTGATLTVFAEVAFGLENLGTPREETMARVEGALRRVGLWGLRDRSPFELSGGQQQRLAIASILAMDPPVIVLDEATSQLDPSGTREVWQVIADLHASGKTLLVVDHKMEYVARHASKVVLMEGGRVVEAGRPSEVLGRDDLEEHGVGRPPFMEVARTLRERGLWAGDLPMTVEEAAGVLRKAAAPRRAAVQKLQTEAPGTVPGIVLEDVCYEYPGGVAALRGISLRISRNETAAMIGENGAGKTTLAKHLNGLLEPTSGRVTVDGVDTRGHTVASMARLVGFVFQNPDDQLFQGQVFKEIAFGPRNLGYPGDEVERLVRWAAGLVGIENLLDRHPFDLGLAERKLVAIASVVAMDTPHVILDEPTTGQDYPGTQKLARLVEKLAAAGKTVIAITHDMEFAAAHFARAIALASGQVIVDGPPKEVFSRAEELQRASVEPPQVARLGRMLGLQECVLEQEALFRALGLV